MTIFLSSSGYSMSLLSVRVRRGSASIYFGVFYFQIRPEEDPACTADRQMSTFCTSRGNFTV